MVPVLLNDFDLSDIFQAITSRRVMFIINPQCTGTNTINNKNGRLSLP